MASTAEIKATKLRSTMGTGERVVISGMSGLYPESNNVKELSDILYNKIDPVKSAKLRWNYSHPEINHTHIGTISGIGEFDAQFFKVHYRLGQNMDVMSRKLLEQTYQAIYDSGINPQQLFGRKVGVYIGASLAEGEKATFYKTKYIGGLSLLANCKTMFANRISYWLNIKGPSLAIDEACCSSTCALEQACNAISSGECESAIVGGGNLSLHPHPFIHLGRLIKLSSDGKTRSFDDNASGLVKSEAINVLFLQKAKDALRIYAEVVHVKCEYTSLIKENIGPKYGFYRNPETTANFIGNFYKDAKVSTTEVEYIEAFGSAIPDADKAELEALEKLFCNDRRESLPIGSVMSNIGYTDAASGISAVTKVLLGYNCGKIAGNMHYDTPRRDVQTLRDGRIRVITEHEKIKGTYIAINGYSLTGVNSHILLHGNNKTKDITRYKSNIPQLICLSGRQTTSVINIIEDLKCRHIDPEELALLRNIHETKISGHLARGFVILDTYGDNVTISHCEKALDFNEKKRPLWFVYSGMGSQWAGMGTQLMCIPVFAAAVEKCRVVLEPKGIDIVNIITSKDEKTFDNILNSFVGIAAIQIGLTDILKELGLLPDKIIGHSVGELGCAYADGCFTYEEMILAAYYRGLVSVQTPFIRGSMAAVGIGYQEISTLCPPEIDVACHNGPNSCTISGPADIVREFVSSLSRKKIFAKEVACSNIAYHSRYISKAGTNLLKYLSEVIKSPKPRSERWVSTSVPQEKWNEPIAKYSSAEYHTNNLLSPVLFEEMLHLIPSNAVLIEIAPHGLLQAILKRSLPATCRHIPLTGRQHPDNVKLILEAFGDLYIEGYDFNLQKLYPKVQFPVSTGTPMLSHLVQWAHLEQWNVPKYVAAQTRMAAVCNYVLSIHDDDFSYLQGHVIREKNILPFAAALVMVWDTLAMFSGVQKKELSVQFRDVHLFYQPTINGQKQSKFRVTIQKVSGRFEIMSEKVKVASGCITEMDVEHNDFTQDAELKENMQLSAKDIYQLFYSRDYSYTGDFRSIYALNLSLTEAQIIWRNNWVTLIDGMLQINALRRYRETVSQPNFIRKIEIDVKKHSDYIKMGEIDVLIATVSDSHDNTRCGGITIDNIIFHDLALLNEVEFKEVKSVSSNGDSKEEELQENTSTNKRVVLKSSEVGDLNSLHWEEEPAPSSPSVSVKVCYAGINSVYLKKETGLTNSGQNETKKVINIDFSGVTKSGARVMGIVQEEAVSTHVTVRPEMLWPVPKYWSLEEAATVPVAYCLAFYCLYMKSFLRPGYRVLVHGGAGALGQAVISIALANNCEIFTTVSSNKKKQFLLNLFPELKENHIGNSRNGSFRDMVLHETRGEGCHIIISCFQGELQNITLKCCSSMGVTIDTSILFSREDFCFRMNHLHPCRNYFTVNLASIFEPKHNNDLTKLQVMLVEGIARGYVRPLSRVIYAPSDVSRAFRLLAASRHRGRVLIDLVNDAMLVKPRLSISPEPYQIIMSNEELIGMQLAEKLVSRGAKKLALVWEKKSNALMFKMRAWEKQGVEIKVIQGQIWDTVNIQSTVEKSTSIRTVDSVYCIVSTQEETEIIRKKMEEITLIVRKECPALKNFVVIVNNDNDAHDYLIKKQEQLLTWIFLPKLKMNESEEYSEIIKRNISLTSAVTGIERALCSKGSIILTIAECPRLPVLQKLCDIDSVPDKEATLWDLGLSTLNLGIVRAYLRDVHNMSLPEDDVLSLTIKTIRSLEEITMVNTIDTDGISEFFSHVGFDELQASADFLCLPTLAHNATTDEEIAPQTEISMYLVPGVDGHHSRFHTLCERLKLPVLALQPGVDFSQETLEQMAMRYVKVLLEKTVVKDTFYLIGYESGVLVTLEMAEILESLGMIGKIYCIGGSPDEVKATFTEKLRDYDTEEKLQCAVLEHMNKLLSNEEKQILDEVLKNNSTWKEKVDLFVQTLKHNVAHSTQYMSLLVKAIYARLDQVLRYDIKPRTLRSQIIFLHPKSSSESQVKSLSLQNYSLQPIIEYTLPSSLTDITQDLRCAAIINRHLGDDVLKEFEKKNTCEIYLLNSDEFVSQ